MARKLPWTGEAGPSLKRARTGDSSFGQTPATDASNRSRPQMRQAQIRMPPTTPSKKRTGSKSPSTSPPRGPPEVEPIREGYDEDDLWMMVEDEFQSLAQTFTAHLHHAEYKRMMKKAREAPRKELLDPTSPMSKEAKRKLQRIALDIKQQATLSRIGARSGVDGIDPEGEEIDNPWKGTALAGLVALGSREKHSLKGLEKMPSSTRAAQGFSKAATTARSRRMNAIDLLSRPPGTRKAIDTSRRREAIEDSDPEDDSNSNATKSAPANSIDDEDHTRSKHTPPPASAQGALSSGSSLHDRSAAKLPAASRGPSKTSFLWKREKLKAESKEDRLAEVPMFLI